jgi:hypothetical protein
MSDEADSECAPKSLAGGGSGSRYAHESALTQR